MQKNDKPIPQIKLPEDTKDLTVPQIKFDTGDAGSDNTDSMEPKAKVHKKRSRKALKITAGVLLSLIALVVLVGILVGIPAVNAYQKAQILKTDGDQVKAAFSSQDIGKIKAALAKTKIDLTSFQSAYNKLAWTKVLPVMGAYWRDGDSAIKGGQYGLDTADVVIKTIEPYADIIGFTTDSKNKAKSGEDTANDRIEFVIQTINQVIPKLDEISKKADLAKAEIDKIDPGRYPEEFRGIKVQSKIREIKDLIDEATSMISEGKPLLEVTPYLLGMDGTRNYLVLFQNDKELRPTGGFLTAYSIMKVRNGKFEPVLSSDIYNLDAKYTPSVLAPDPLIKYLKGPYTLSGKFRLRDMNWSPDFKQSMDLFTKEAKSAGVSNIDGIIAVDTHVLVKLLEVIGKIGVPGFGNFSSETDPKCNCPQVIYELESFADVEGPVVWSQDEPGKIIFAPKNYDNRKKIVGPLMNSIMSNALGQPKDKMAKLFQAGWESLTEKHIMLYAFDPKVQKAAEDFNIAGTINDYKGDYLHISDANLGGRKSNLYVTQEVSQEVAVGKDGAIEKTLTITYKNSQSQDGWLNSVLPSWVRIYVPKGSTLVSADGFEAKIDPYEDLGKTVFAGLYRLRPLGVVKLTLKYKIPGKAGSEYRLLVQKQPGTDAPLYNIKVKRQKEELYLKTDKEFKFSL